MNREKLAKRLISAGSLILNVAVFYFAYKYAQGLAHREEFTGLSLQLIPLVLSVILFLGFYLLLAVHWLRVCRLIDKNTDKKQLVAFFASQPYKYLPSSLFTFSFRAKFAKAAGLSVKKSSVAQLIENISIISSAFLVAFVFYMATASPLIALAAITLIIIFYFWLPDVLYINFKKDRRESAKKRLLSIFILACSGWIIAGLSFLLAAKSIGYDIEPAKAIAANAAAYGAGILAFFAPGGIGVRELVLAFFKIGSPVFIVWRFVTFACDMLFGFSAVILLKATRKR